MKFGSDFRSKKLAASVCLALTMMASNCYAFSVDFVTGTPVTEAVRALALKAGKNVIINGDIKGSVSIKMNDTDFDSALKALSVAGNFSYEYMDGTVLVAPSASLNTIETFKLNYISPDSFAKQLGALISSDKIVADNEMHTVTVTGSNNVMRKVEDQLKKFDVAQKQINIKATVIELSKTKTRNMGLSYLSDSWTKDTSVAGYNGFKFSVTGAHEETLGNGNVLARPNITTFDGKNAKLMMGDKVPVFTSTSDGSDTSSDSTLTVEYKDVGVTLDVTPRINDADKDLITMVIKPKVSTISQWVESGNNKAPQISERSAETIVRVKSGETILIGGLLKDEEIKSIKQIPFLSKLPILGELFKSRSIDKKNSEVVIAITPTIMIDEDGRPRVELQKTTPKLHHKLSELQNEPEMDSSVDVSMAETDVDPALRPESAVAQESELDFYGNNSGSETVNAFGYNIED